MLTLLSLAALAQEPLDHIAQVEVEDRQGSLVLSFGDRDYTSTTIQRRAVGTLDRWTSAETVATLGSELEWTDPDVQPGDAWEYRVSRSGTYSAVGYAVGVLEEERADTLGQVALVVEESVSEALSEELARLELDLIGEGWMVERFEVAADATPPEVKALYADLPWLDTVFLIGHVPVPYSGQLNPDGHSNHRGAWPADTYYGDLDGEWTDTTVNDTSSSYEANHNIPGDGKFDPSSIPSDLEVSVGRADFHDLPAFELEEVELLRRYLDKDHAWRNGQVQATPGVVIDDNFGTYAPGSYSGWLLAPVVGRDNLFAGDFLTELGTTPWLFGYGSGGGSFSSASGVASTNDFATREVLGTFLMIFGSYHGDWNTPNNLLRAAIAGEGHALTCMWGGRPVAQHHALGAGETIGFAHRLTQNSYEYLPSDYAPRGVHTALLGDPTLRAFPMVPPEDLVAEVLDDTGAVELTWTAASDEVLGYHVYRSDAVEGPYERLTDEPVEGDSYEDLVLTEGVWHWMVRAVALEHTPSGSFSNLSQGALASEQVDCTRCGEVGDTGEEGGSGGCGCASTSGSWPWWLLLLGLPWVRRRR